MNQSTNSRDLDRSFSAINRPILGKKSPFALSADSHSFFPFQNFHIEPHFLSAASTILCPFIRIYTLDSTGSKPINTNLKLTQPPNYQQPKNPHYEISLHQFPGVKSLGNAHFSSMPRLQQSIS